MSEKVMFGAGCFWGVEARLQQLEGVVKTQVGYSGGSTSSPTYEQVCSGQTGHAEVVEVEYDSSKISIEALLDVYFELHDPTQLNRQGPDTGTQYRSVVFYSHPSQKEATLNKIESIKARYENPIVTDVLEAQTFWKAEEYHQCYIAKQNRQ